MVGKRIWGARLGICDLRYTGCGPARLSVSNCCEVKGLKVSFEGQSFRQGGTAIVR